MDLINPSLRAGRCRRRWPIFNAASSPRGLEFTGKFCDIYFTSTYDFEGGGERAREIRKTVWQNYHRTIEILEEEATGSYRP